MDIFVDTSVLIEHIKGRNTSLFIELSDIKHTRFINDIIYSEFIYHFLGFASNKSPLAAKESNQIANILNKHNPFKFLSTFNILENNLSILELSYKYMSGYNLLPNDSIIMLHVNFMKS